MKVSIIVPAHNEQQRIGTMLKTYYQFFDTLEQKEKITCEFIIVLNGCSDNTLDVVQNASQYFKQTVIIIDLPQAGKGLAIKAGFENALKRNNDLIGFVDADMATRPHYFYDLIKNIGNYDGIIASRYMPGSHLDPPRPWIKKWGRRIVYNSLVRLLFGLNFYDYQCGAKLFTHNVIKKVTPHLTAKQWAFDIELLYLCALFDFKIKEIPTTWYDQSDSKFNIIRSGTPMIKSLFSLWRQYRTVELK